MVNVVLKETLVLKEILLLAVLTIHIIGGIAEGFLEDKQEIVTFASLKMVGGPIGLLVFQALENVVQDTSINIVTTQVLLVEVLVMVN